MTSTDNYALLDGPHNVDGPAEFADRMADYLATSAAPWRDPQVMREAVRTFMSVVTNDMGAQRELLRAIGFTAQDADAIAYGIDPPYEPDQPRTPARVVPEGVYTSGQVMTRCHLATGVIDLLFRDRDGKTVAIAISTAAAEDLHGHLGRNVERLRRSKS